MLLDFTMNVITSSIWAIFILIYGYSTLGVLSGTVTMLDGPKEFKMDDYLYLLGFYVVFVVMTYAFVKTF